MNIEFTARGVLSVFFRKRVTILVVFLFVILGGLLYIIFSPPLYEEVGTLLVKFGHEGVQGIVNSDNGDISQNARREIMESNMEILKSHGLLQELVKDFGPEKLYPGITDRMSGIDSPVEATIRKLLKGDLTVTSGSQSYIIEVKLLNENSQVATDFVRQLIALFITRQSEVYNNPESKLLQEQVKQAADRLKRSQQALQDFKAKMGVSSIDEELTRLIQEKGDAETIAFQAVDDAEDNLMVLRAQETTLLATYKPGSAPVQQIRKSIAQARQQLAERQADLAPLTESSSPSDTALKTSASSRKKTGILATHFAEINRKIEQLEEQRNHYNDLNRQVSIDEENYKNYMVHSEEARLNDTLNQKKVTQISVLDEPEPQIRPARPRKMLIMALCFVGGIIGSLGVALISELLDERITTPEQLSAELELPVMAIFSAMAKG